MSESMIEESIPKFIRTLLNEDEDALLDLMTWVKQLLTTPHVKPSRAFVLCGPPGCGKTAFFTLVERALGKHAYVLRDFERTLKERIDWPTLRFAHPTILLLDELPTGHRTVADWKKDLRMLITDDSTRSETKLCSYILLATNCCKSPQDCPPVLEELDFVRILRCARSVMDWSCLGLCGHIDGKEIKRILVCYATKLRGAFGWKRVRAYWRARWLAVFWHSLLVKHMAPGGRIAKRDRETYESDMVEAPSRLVHARRSCEK